MTNRMDALLVALNTDPAVLGARSRAKTNEYRAEHGTPNLPKCRRCDSYRYDRAVTGPDVDAMCGPRYCHYAV